MAIDFRSSHVEFDSTAGITQTLQGAVVFPNGSTVNRADIAIKKFDIKYDNGDHHVVRERISTSIASINQNVVTFEVKFLLRDSSGNIDDPFSGSVDVLVIADLTAPRPVTRSSTLNGASGIRRTSKADRLVGVGAAEDDEDA